MEVLGRKREFHCDPCGHDGDTLPAEGYCVDCREYLCSTCYKGHRRLRLCRHHRLQDKISMPKVKTTSRVNDLCIEICQTHHKIIEYFCNSHESFGCSACITTQHRACEKVDFIPEIAATFDTSKELGELQRKLTELFKDTENKKSEISRRSKAIAFQAERAKMHVKNTRAKIVDLFEKLEKKIDESINELKDKDEKKMTEMEKKVNRISEELQRHIADIQSCLNEKKLCQLFVEAKRIQEPLNNLSGEVASISDSCKIQRYQFKANPVVTEMLEKMTEIGYLEIMHEQAKWPTFEKDINVRTESEENKCEISGITLLSEELLVVADKENKNIKLIDIVNNDIKSTYKSEQNGSLIQPFDVTKIDVAQIAVTYISKIQFLGISESGSMTMYREIKASGCCRGIACMGDNVIVSFVCPPSVKILTMTGAVTRTIALDGEYTFYVAVNSLQNLIYVSNRTVSRTGSVICITTDGQKKTVFEDNTLKGPQGVDINTHGMYVCGRWSDNVVQLSEDCSMIHELLNKDDGLNRPMSLALTGNNDKLYIGMDGDNIKVFNLM